MPPPLAAAAADPSVWPMLVLAAVVLAGAAWLAGGPRWQARRRAALRLQPFPAAWRAILRRRVPVVARLPVPLQQRLKGHVQVFLADKAFIGCQGQPVSDEHRVTIAAQACLLLLGQADARAPVFPQLRQVLVYPGPFAVQRPVAAPGGVQQLQQQALAGESWQQGQVLLSWPDARAGAADADDGQNLVLHEFAHQIDQDKGEADGRPWRAAAATRRRWQAVMDAAFEHLRAQPSALLGDYAAQSPAEFFAVLTERFYEQPAALADEWPAVYQELVALYQVDPRAWT